MIEKQIIAGFVLKSLLKTVSYSNDGGAYRTITIKTTTRKLLSVNLSAERLDTLRLKADKILIDSCNHFESIEVVLPKVVWVMTNHKYLQPYKVNKKLVSKLAVKDAGSPRESVAFANVIMSNIEKD